MIALPLIISPAALRSSSSSRSVRAASTVALRRALKSVSCEPWKAFEFRR